MKTRKKQSVLLKKSSALIRPPLVLALGPSELDRADVFDRNHSKILTPKQMLQRLPIALGQVELGNAF